MIEKEFVKVTGVADAWTNPLFVRERNGFIQGWEAAILRSAILQENGAANVKANEHQTV